MSKQKHEGHMVIGAAELRHGASRYVGAITSVLDQVVTGDKPLHQVASEMLQMGYAVGVVAGKLSDIGIEGFTLILRGIELSMQVEERAERIQYAVWDKDGDLHTSDDMKKGGEQ